MDFICREFSLFMDASTGFEGRKGFVAALDPGKILGFFGFGAQALFTIATRH
jgi:hypothetical protein